MVLRVGQKAPAFDVVSSDGRRLKLGDFLGNKNVVLYFYPRDFTSVCTKEACGFRDIHEDLAALDTEIIGVSADSKESHQKFAEKYKVSFDLVADENRELAKAYGATSFLHDRLGVTTRITYVIDKKGEIAGVFTGEFSANKHTDGVRDLVRRLAAAD
ncbi:MAG: peroxiredoxin [Polyangiaceae bacterium]|nr:peroxiredoxin [Polyangiaceae bacterium]